MSQRSRLVFGKWVPGYRLLPVLFLIISMIYAQSIVPAHVSAQSEQETTPGFTDDDGDPSLEPTQIPPAPTDIPAVPTDVPPAPTDISLPTATDVPAMELEPTMPAAATVEPSPGTIPTAVAATAPPEISGESVISGSGCTQISPTDVVPAMTPVEFSCGGANGPGNSSVTRTFSNLTAGWEYQVNNGPWRNTVEPVFSQLDQIPAFTLRLRATVSAPSGSGGGLSISVQTSNGSGGAYTTRIGATVAGGVPPTATDLQLACTPSALTVDPGQSSTVSCTYSARQSLGNRQVTLTRITVPAPIGWTITGPAGSVTGTTLTITPNAPISYSGTAPLSYAFTYTMTPGCAASTSPQTMNLTSQFTFNATTGIAGPATSGQIARSTASNLAVSVGSNSLAWYQEFSLTESVVSGNLVYRLSASSCSGWDVTISASPYVYSGPNAGQSIPASNLILTTAQDPVVIEGSGTGVTNAGGSGPMNTTRRLLSAGSGSGIGTYEQQLDFSLTIPGRARAGTYQSTITITSAAAP